MRSAGREPRASVCLHSRRPRLLHGDTGRSLWTNETRRSGPHLRPPRPSAPNYPEPTTTSRPGPPLGASEPDERGRGVRGEPLARRLESQARSAEEEKSTSVTLREVRSQINGPRDRSPNPTPRASVRKKLKYFRTPAFQGGQESDPRTPPPHTSRRSRLE